MAGLVDSLGLVKKYGIHIARHRAASNFDELHEACESVGFPVAMKVVSEKISHKTDVGGVAVGLENFTEAKSAFSGMKRLKGVQGVLVQEMVKGKEVIIGGKYDVQFGPTVLFGLGGVFVEIFKDFSIGVCPLRRKDARRMMQEIKAYPILKGYRGKKGVNLNELESTILKVGKLMEKENVSELDLNPVIANERKVTAVDARVTFR